MSRLALLLAGLVSVSACTPIAPPVALADSTVPSATPAVIPVAAGSGASPPLGFDIAAPSDTTSLRRIPLWTTAYIVKLANLDRSPNAVPLTGQNQTPLGVSISHSDWCHAAMEGTVAVRLDDGSERVFNYAGTQPSTVTDCSDVFRSMARTAPQKVAAVSRSYFTEVRSSTPFGTGGTGTCDGATTRFKLLPHRSIAVDRSVIPLGSAVFIPRLRGAPIQLPGGRSATHDGFVFAADTGGAIRGHHIDYFKGPAANDQILPAIKADERHPIDSYLVTDPQIISSLCRAHRITPPG